MTRTMLREALSALAAVTLASAGAGSPAASQSHTIRAYRAEVAMDAVRGPKPETVRTEKQQPTPPRNANGQDWRWFQDYGGGRLSQPSEGVAQHSGAPRL